MLVISITVAVFVKYQALNASRHIKIMSPWVAFFPPVLSHERFFTAITGNIQRVYAIDNSFENLPNLFLRSFIDLIILIDLWTV